MTSVIRYRQVFEVGGNDVYNYFVTPGNFLNFIPFVTILSKMDERTSIDTNLPNQINFTSILNGVKNYEGITTKLRKTFSSLKESGIERIGFVSGPVANSSETEPGLRVQSIKEKMELMRQFTLKLRLKYQFPILSSTDIFDIVWKELEETNLPTEERAVKMKELFREILKGGVTDIFMMPSWKESPGAIDEYETAKQIGIVIHDSEIELELEME